MKRVGVCSWSLRPTQYSDLIDRVRQCDLSQVQIALEPIASGHWGTNAVDELLEDSQIRFCSGMMETVGEDYSTLESIKHTGGIRPDEHWEANKAKARKNATIAHQLGIKLVTFHAGFVPDAITLEYQKIIDRIKEIADIFGQYEISLGLETGQERPEELLDLLAHPALLHVGVNFDPANLILYGSGDPSSAIELLRDRIIQVHMKDAIAPENPGSWGIEVPVSQGEVDWGQFFGIVHSLVGEINIVIEREVGDQRVQDIIKAREVAVTHGCER